jgi:hypothetical protein
MYFRGVAPAIAQVDTFTPTVANSATYLLLAEDDEGNSYEISYGSDGSATAQEIVEGLKAAADLAKSLGHGPWDEITATENDSILTLTVDTAGKPIYYTVYGAPGELVKTNTTPNSGPYDWNCGANWYGGDDMPGDDAGDVVYIENAIIKYGLNQSGIANALSALYITKSQIGQEPVITYPSYLQIKATKVDINYQNDPGAASFLSPVNLDLGATQSTITVFNSATASTRPSINIKCNHASTKLHILLGAVGVANNAGETATLAEINVLGGACYIGDGVTLTTLLNRVGSTLLRSACTTLTLDSGAVRTEGIGAITTVNINGGSAVLNASGTITNLNAIDGQADMSQSSVSRTVTTAKIGSGGSVKYDPNVVTMTNKVQPYNSSGNITLSAA